MQGPPEKKRRKQTTTTLPQELWLRIAEFANSGNVARMSRTGRELRTTLSPLLYCDHLIKDGTLCFTERHDGKTGASYRIQCPKQCDRFTTKYIDLILRIAEDMVGNPQNYRILQNGRLLAFNVTLLCFDTTDDLIQFDKGRKCWFYPDRWVQNDFLETVARSQLVKLISNLGRIEAEMIIGARDIDHGKFFSIVKEEKGHYKPLAPLFDHLTSEFGVVTLQQALKGPEIDRSSGYTPSAEYMFETMWN